MCNQNSEFKVVYEHLAMKKITLPSRDQVRGTINLLFAGALVASGALITHHYGSRVNWNLVGCALGGGTTHTCAQDDSNHSVITQKNEFTPQSLQAAPAPSEIISLRDAPKPQQQVALGLSLDDLKLLNMPPPTGATPPAAASYIPPSTRNQGRPSVHVSDGKGEEAVTVEIRARGKISEGQTKPGFSF